MKERLDEKTLRVLSGAGIGFVGDVPAPGGNVSAYLSADDLQEFCDDKGAWYARVHGVSKKDYEDWVAADGLPRCGATTRNGVRCKNPVSGGGQRELLDWLNEDAGFCTKHGGIDSRNAHSRRFHSP